MKDVFFCPEESKFYSHCLENLVFNRCNQPQSIVEFGSGDGSPVINSLLRTNFQGVVHGFELNKSACKTAHLTIEEFNLFGRYVIHNACFFESPKPPAEYLISNPPYLPAPDNNICMPLLHGGTDGATLTKQLFTLGYANLLLMISSFSDPKDTVEYARRQEYCISDFVVVPLQFGYYSSEPKVKNAISEMRKANKAFYSSSIYFLAGALFTKKNQSKIDLSKEFIQIMTAL